MLEFLLTQTPLFYLTQSFWRDEAFSVLTSQQSISNFIGTLNFEPPVFYLLLHFWIKLFGTSEIATRSLSLVGFLLAASVIVFWSEQVFKKHWLAYLTPFLFFFNPMLLYYAFEVRAYGWFMFFSTLSLYAYSTKRYKLLAVANIFAFYTHSYAIFIPFVQGLHYLLTNYRQAPFHPFSLKRITNLAIFRSLLLWFLAILPWLFVIFEEAKKMRPTWYFPVDMQLVRSVLGNMFTSYDGTPGGYWKHTFILSIILLVLFIAGLKKRSLRRETSYLFTMIFVPLLIVISISFVKPLFVNRYLIYVTIAQIMLISYAIYQMKRKWIQAGVAIGLVLFLISTNTFLPARKAKLDIRSTIREANAIRGQDDVLYVTSPLIFFEALYYTKDRENVYLYNPGLSSFPWYVGESAFDPSKNVRSYPEYPQRAVVIGEDQTITIAYTMDYSQKTKSMNLPADSK